MKKETPLKAIRRKCIDCSGWDKKEVRECIFDGVKDELCPLWPLRMGKGSRSTLKSIRKYCMWCCKDQPIEIKLCPSVKCSLWPYRFGKRSQKSLSLPLIFTTEGVLQLARV